MHGHNRLAVEKVARCYSSFEIKSSFHSTLRPTVEVFAGLHLYGSRSIFFKDDDAENNDMEERKKNEKLLTEEEAVHMPSTSYTTTPQGIGVKRASASLVTSPIPLPSPLALAPKDTPRIGHSSSSTAAGSTGTPSKAMLLTLVSFDPSLKAASQLCVSGYSKGQTCEKHFIITILISTFVIYS
ncbi:hypothetical protein BC827DRAFT_735729 [Russula dissimulans]|nr:hypothetical protein BC827DRAFT_829671 [Russula dissimulans]KAH9956938.1 hypothetical protein BC827DRAFT_735729 [Russula dissimulans]